MFRDKKCSVNIKMNYLYDLSSAYQEKRNIFQEVRKFQKQNFNSQNFQDVMEWIREAMELSNLAYQNEVIANLTLKTENDAVEIKVKTGYLTCHLYAWKMKGKNNPV